MMIELLGTRIIGPFYGVSIYVWSSLISVALVALALGYYIGGNIADKFDFIRLPHIIALSALFIAIIPLISHAVLVTTEALGLRAGAFTSTLLLFAAPLTLLGMVSPYAIKLTADRLEGVGSASGSIYAVGTLGSFIGTLLLGFFLLPLVGSRSIIQSISILLLLLAILFAVYEFRRTPKKVSLMVTLLVSSLTTASLFAAYRSSTSIDDFHVQLETDSVQGWVRVVDQPDKNIRWLMSDGSTIGAASLSTGNGLLAYQQFVSLIPAFNHEASNALVIGLGAGHLLNYFSAQDIETDAIEIDQAVVDAAINHFNFESSGDVIVGDARYEIKRMDKRYDFIVHDCFTGGSDPSHLLSKEMFQSLQARLSDDGIIAITVVGFVKGENSAPAASIARTLDAVFEHTRAYVVSPGAEFDDIIFLASNKPLVLEAQGVDLRTIEKLKQHEFQFAKSDGLVITDDFNPLEYLQTPKTERYRELLVGRLGKELLLR